MADSPKNVSAARGLLGVAFICGGLVLWLISADGWSCSGSAGADTPPEAADPAPTP